MSILAALALFALFASGNPVSDVPVEVGRFDPAAFPEAVRLDRRMPNGEMVRRVETILSEGQCTIEGAREGRFNIVVPFALLMEPDGFTSTVVVSEMGCVPLETLVGQVVLAQLERGDFRPDHEEGERWYVSELAFALGVEDQAVTIAQEDPERMICRAAEPELGSRLRMRRMCRTAEQWRQYEADMAQMRRDISSAARCGNELCQSQ